jgi:hypothetical protein
VAEISRFYGIVVSIFFLDHGIPHIHGRYGGYQASISIADGSVLGGHLPRKELRCLREWILVNQADLYATWDRARRGRAVTRIPPLR